MANKIDFWDFDQELEETPTCRVIVFQGKAKSGKTTTTSMLSKRTVFISTDGNAGKQGYRALDFQLLPAKPDEEPAERVWRSLTRLLKALYKNKDKFDSIAFDLIDYYDVLLTKLYSSGDTSGFDISFERVQIQDWGQIGAFYRNLAVLVDEMFGDKVIFYLSRVVEQEVTTANMKKKTIEVPALRLKMRNHIDSSVSLWLNIDEDHTLEFVGDYRFKGTPTNPIEAEVLNNVKRIMLEQGSLTEEEL